MHAYDGLQGNQRLYEPFLKMLANYGVPRPAELLGKVTQSYLRSMETMGPGVSDALSPRNVMVGTKRPCDFYFLERHISA